MSIFCCTGFCCWAPTKDASYKWLSEILQQWWHLAGRQWFTQFTPWWQTVTLYTLSEEKPWPWTWLFGCGHSSCQSMDGCRVELDCWFEVPVFWASLLSPLCWFVCESEKTQYMNWNRKVLGPLFCNFRQSYYILFLINSSCSGCWNYLLCEAVPQSHQQLETLYLWFPSYNKYLFVLCLYDSSA